MPVYAIAEQRGLIKIGRTRDIRVRMVALAGANPYPIDLLAYWHGGAREEAALHVRFAARRQHGEWFDMAGLDVVAEITGALGWEPLPHPDLSGRQRPRTLSPECIAERAPADVPPAELPREVVTALQPYLGTRARLQVSIPSRPGAVVYGTKYVWQAPREVVELPGVTL